MKRGFVCGAWDLLHAGHILLLRECAKNCDFLIVGLHVDPSIERKDKTKPIQSIYERMIQLRGCEYVGLVVVYETEEELETILKSSHLDIRFLGSDYTGKPKTITAEDSVPMKIINRCHKYSSTELKERLKK